MSESRVSPKRIYIVRHGERFDHVHPEWKLTAREPHDPHLSTNGCEQAKQTGKFIFEREFELIKRPVDQSSSCLNVSHSQRRLAHRSADELHHLNDQAIHESIDDLASISIFSSPFLRCVETAKCISEAYCAELLNKSHKQPDNQSNNQSNSQFNNRTSQAWHDVDVQIKIEHGLAEFLTPCQ